MAFVYGCMNCRVRCIAQTPEGQPLPKVLEEISKSESWTFTSFKHLDTAENADCVPIGSFCFEISPEI